MPQFPTSLCVCPQPPSTTDTPGQPFPSCWDTPPFCVRCLEAVPLLPTRLMTGQTGDALSSVSKTGHCRVWSGSFFVFFVFKIFFFFFAVDHFLSLYWICDNIASALRVLVFWLRGMWDLSSLTRARTRTPCIGRRSLNHRTARDVPEVGPCPHVSTKQRENQWVVRSIKTGDHELLEMLLGGANRGSHAL